MNKSSITNAQRLAAEILGQLNGVLTMKLRELKPQLEKLRLCFRNIGKHDRIEGCRTWEQFCSEKLHRTDRAVRKLLAEVKAGETGEEGHTRAEESSAVSDATTGTCDASAQNASEEYASEDGGAEEGRRQDEAGAWEEAKSSAKKKIRHFFTPLDSVDSIESKVNDMLDGLIPCRKFKVTVKEVTEGVSQ